MQEQNQVWKAANYLPTLCLIWHYSAHWIIHFGAFLLVVGFFKADFEIYQAAHLEIKALTDNHSVLYA